MGERRLAEKVVVKAVCCRRSKIAPLLAVMPI